MQSEDELLDRPMRSKMKSDLPPLPELTMLDTQITDVKHQTAMFQGKVQYVQKMDTKELVLGPDGNPIERKEFNITFSIHGYDLPNGTPRKKWLALGASLSEKSKLSKFLKIINVNLINPTPRALITCLIGKNVRFQLVNNGDYQNINFDSIRSADKKEIKPEDITWEP